MPTRRSELASALLDGKIYVAGGIGENWTTRAELERYDIATNTWETLSPMPVGLHHLGMAATSTGWIFITGGYTDMNFTADQAATYVYDPAAIKCVVVGERMDRAHRRRIEQIMNDLDPRIPIRTARRSRSEYEVLVG